MSRPFVLIFVGWMLFLSLPGCYVPEQGANSRQIRGVLNQISDRSISIEKKYLLVTDTYVKLLEEAAGKRTDEAAMDHLRKFYNDNLAALKQIGWEFDGWQRVTDDDARSAFFYVLHQQPNTRKLANLSRDFRNRITYRDDWVVEFDKLMSFLEIKR